MLERFYPRLYVDSASQVPYETLWEKGYRGVIFDIDNTLVEHGEPADARAKELFSRLHAIGFQTCLLSNNKEARVRPFAQGVKSAYLAKAGKPGRAGYERAMQRMGTNRENTLFVGDQLFTDVWGANRAGIFGILVRPINPKEEIQIVLKRFLERPILWAYRRKQRKGKG